MTVRLDEDGRIHLVGTCDASEAEVLQRRLLENTGAAVDWRDCDQIHTAVLQVMLAAGVDPIGPPRGKFLIEMLEPFLKRRYITAGHESPGSRRGEG